MQCFSVTEIQNTPSEALHQAAVEPVLLTAESQPSYVIMSIDNYEHSIALGTLRERQTDSKTIASEYNRFTILWN